MYVVNAGRLAGVHLNVEEIALSTDVQLRKLDAILTALNETFGLNEETAKWNVKREPNQILSMTGLHIYEHTPTVLPLQSVSHSQQGPVGYITSSGCYCEAFPTPIWHCL